MPASAALHLSALAALLPWPAGAGAGHAEAPPIEVELVQQRDAVQGTRPADAASAPAPAEHPLRANAEAAPRLSGGRPVPAKAALPVAVNLGDADETVDGMDVTGKGVIPPGPDSAFRNQPPAYPIQAARVGAQGTVALVVHVSAQGLPQDVVVAGSSGSAALDRAARNAVLRWHFTPARLQGAPMPFDYPLDIRFVLGDRQ